MHRHYPSFIFQFSVTSYIQHTFYLPSKFWKLYVSILPAVVTECPSTVVEGGWWGRQVFTLRLVHVSYYQEERKCKKKTKHISGGIDLTFSWMSCAQFSMEDDIYYTNKLTKQNLFHYNQDGSFILFVCNCGTLYLENYVKLFNVTWNQRTLIFFS